jgi:hypothetical protein
MGESRQALATLKANEWKIGLSFEVTHDVLDAEHECGWLLKQFDRTSARSGTPPDRDLRLGDVDRVSYLLERFYRREAKIGEAGADAHGSDFLLGGNQDVW